MSCKIKVFFLATYEAFSRETARKSVWNIFVILCFRQGWRGLHFYENALAACRENIINRGKQL